METLIRNLLILFGILFIIDFVASYPWTIQKVDSMVDKATLTIMGDKGE